MIIGKKTGFFKVEHFIPNWKTSMIGKFMIFMGGRNIGKTTNIWNIIEKDFIKKGKRFAYFRNKQEELKTAINDFNNRFYGKYICYGNGFVYQLQAYSDDKTGGVKYTTDKEFIIGVFGAISTPGTLKSIGFNDVKIIFYDEYNEESLGGVKNAFNKFINIATTIARFSKVYMIFLGNRDSINNQFMVNFGIDYKDSYRQSSIQVIPDRDDATKYIGKFIEIGSEDYEALDNKGMLVYKMARYGNGTDRYISGDGYIQDTAKLVLNFEKWIRDSAIKRYDFDLSDSIYSFGTFILNDVEKYFLTSRSVPGEVSRYALDSWGSLLGQSSIIDVETKDRIRNMLLNLFRNKELYFTDFDTHELFRQYAKLDNDLRLDI